MVCKVCDRGLWCRVQSLGSSILGLGPQVSYHTRDGLVAWHVGLVTSKSKHARDARISCRWNFIAGCYSPPYRGRLYRTCGHLDREYDLTWRCSCFSSSRLEDPGILASTLTRP